MLWCALAVGLLAAPVSAASDGPPEIQTFTLAVDGTCTKMRSAGDELLAAAQETPCPAHKHPPRMVRMGKDTCFLEPFFELPCAPDEVCSTGLTEIPCPEALTGSGFIRIEGDGCELTLAGEDNQRTTTSTPCPATLTGWVEPAAPQPQEQPADLPVTGPGE